MRRAGLFAILLSVALAVVLVFLITPVIAIFVDAGPAELLDSLGEPEAREALWLSLKTTLAALALIVTFGTPAAYLLATREFRGKVAVTTAIELPLVLPPAVAGIGLLAAFGPEGILGGWLDQAGVELVLADRGRDRRADLRRGALLHPSGTGGVCGGRHASCSTRPGRWARERRAPSPGSRSRAPGRGSAPGWPSPGAGRWASSARR